MDVLGCAWRLSVQYKSMLGKCIVWVMAGWYVRMIVKAACVAVVASLEL